MTDEEKEEQGAPKDSGEGSKPEATTLVDEANAAAERLEKANERKAELLRQEEELAAKRALGGRSDAGQNKEVSEEEKKKQGAKEFFKGTLVETAIEKHG